VELVAPRALGSDEAGTLEDVEMLGDRLPAGADAVFRRQAPTELEERLAVAIGQLVENRASGPVGQRPEQEFTPRRL
jgi:hypothetical protein